MKKLTRKAVRFNGLTLGLDVHKKFIEYCVLDRKGNELEGKRIDSTKDALKELVARLKKRGPVQATLEACGCFIWIFDLLVAELGREVVHVAQPSRLHVIANSMEKNDSNDAWWLAYVLYEGRMPESFVAEGVLRELRIAARELRWYTDMRADLLRRFKSHLAQMGIAVPKNWHTSKVGREKAVAVLAELKGERRLALKLLMKEIKALGAVMKVWRERMAEVSKSIPQVKTIMDEMPGFGLTISGSVTGELGDPRRYYSAKAYAKGSGLPPGYRESGGKGQATGITRQGSALARWGFTRAVVSCLRCKKGPGAQIKQWVEEHSKTRPKGKMIVAAARKMAEAVWRLFALGEAFDLVKAFPVKGVVPQ